MKLEPAYITGFVDGEGTLGVVKLSKNRVRPQFLVFNTNKKILESIKETLDINAPIFESSRVPDGIQRRKTCYRLQARSREDITKIINFFEQNPLIIKKNDYSKFRNCYNNWK